MNRLLGLRPGETRLVLILGFVLMGNSLALSMANVVSVSGFLSEVGVNEILIVWIVDLALVVLATGLQSLIVDRFDRVALLRWMAIGFALVYVGLRTMFVLDIPNWINYSVLFLLTEQQYLFFPLIFWILANDVFDMAQSKRLFPLLTTGNFVGQILGLGLAAFAPRFLAHYDLASTEMLAFIAVVYLLAFIIIDEGLRSLDVRQTKHKPETVREALTEGWGFVREVPSFRYLMIAIMLLTIAFTIVEFHFLFVSEDTIDNADDFQTFYSLYNMGATLAAIVIQTLLTRRIINRITLKNAFFIFPVTLVCGLSWLLAWPMGIISALFGVGLPRLVRGTIGETARKSIQALVPPERRGRVSMFMDSYLFAVGGLIGSVLAGVIIFLTKANNTIPYYAYLTVALVSTIVAIWFTFRMRSVYDASLLNWRLKRRQRRANVLDKLNF